MPFSSHNQMTNAVVSLHRTILYINGTLTFAGNSLLVYLIIFHTKSNIENYRHLMIIFAVIYDGLFVEYFSRKVQSHLSIAYCGFFAQSLTILAFHFLYRYIVICKPQLMYIFQKWFHICCLVLLYCVVPFVWDLICAFLIPMTTEKDELVEEAFREFYNSSIFQRGYCGPLFRHPSDNSWILTESMGIFSLTSIITLGLGIILVAAKRIYKILNTEAMSSTTRTLQRQLFRVLVVQTTIPVCCAHLPGYALFIGSIVGSDYRMNIGYFLSIAISTFPVIDPLIMLYFLSDYRTVILKFFGCRKPAISHTDSTPMPRFAGT